MEQRKKLFLLGSKPDLRQHSAMSVVKKKLAIMHSGSTPGDKVIYAEKCLIEAMDRYIQAKAEAAECWTSYMEKETNTAIKEVYLNLCKLDGVWVNLHHRYRLQLPDQRALFKRLMNGEKEIEKLWKESQSTASKVVKLTKQLDEYLRRFRSGKPIDMEVIRAKETDVHQALKSNRKAQKQYEVALQNHKKYKYNEVKKLIKNLCEAEVELQEDSWKLSKLKRQIYELFLNDSFNKLEETKTIRASEKSRELIDAFCREMNISSDPTYLSASVMCNRPLPSAPQLEDLAEAASQHFDDDALYKPMPDAESNDDTEEPDYIYEGVDLDSDSDDCDYDYVADLVDKKDQVIDATSRYLMLIEGRDVGEPRPAGFTEISSDYKVPNLPRPVVTKSEPDEEIFGSISSLRLETTDSRAKRKPQTADAGYDSPRTLPHAAPVKSSIEQFEEDECPPLPEKKNKKRVAPSGDKDG